MVVGVVDTGVGVGAPDIEVAGVGVVSPSVDCRDSPNVAWGGVGSTSNVESSDVECLSCIAFRNTQYIICSCQ